MSITTCACASQLDLGTPNNQFMTSPFENAINVMSNEIVEASITGTARYAPIALTSINVSIENRSVAGKIHNDGKRIQFISEQPFAYNTRYTASVKATFSDLQQEKIIEAAYSWNFHTIDATSKNIVWFADFNHENPALYTKENLHKNWQAASSAGIKEGRVSIVKNGDSAGNMLQIRYEANTYGLGRGGVQWKTRIGTYDELYLSYWLKFSPEFNFVKGGKLPGLAGGAANTGGKIPNGSDGWSGRITWSDSGKMNQYIYHPGQAHKHATAFWWDVGGQRHFIPGKWHTVETRIKMNTPGQRNGLVQSWFDGILALDLNGMHFRDVDSFAINWFMFSSFFGGGDTSWASKKQEYAYFDNIVISTKPITH